MDPKDIDALLPQTQCGECDYPDCISYAQALASKTAPINRCLPGGVSTLNALGDLLDIDPSPYLESLPYKPIETAMIREEDCIGCTKCIQACPVDAIVGSNKQMHHILQHECTGCMLCVEPCPVDCIEAVAEPEFNYHPDLARKRYNEKQVRALQRQQQKRERYLNKRTLARQTTHQEDKQAKQDYIQAALRRVKDRRHEQA